MRRIVQAMCFALALSSAPAAGLAAEGFRLAAPAELIETGFLKYVLPRFSLKTGVPIELVAAPAQAEAELAAAGDGQPVFTGPRHRWRLRLHAGTHEGARDFADWLTSEIGQRTITGFKREGVAVFSLPEQAEAEVAEVSFQGDAAAGAQLSALHCGRCHAITPGGAMNDIGSTPSFAVLRALRDWDARFESFYVRNPHPAFTQIAEVTLPFPVNRPSPIIPVEMTIEELEAILAFVSGMKPADLGAPIQHQ